MKCGTRLITGNAGTTGTDPASFVNGRTVGPTVSQAATAPMMPPAQSVTNAQSARIAAAPQSRGWWNNLEEAKKRNLTIIVASISVFVIAVVGINMVQHRDVFPRAVRACESQVDSDTWDFAEKYKAFEVTDGGRTMTITATYLSDDVTSCLLSELDTPDSVRTKMGNTRALDGTQTDSWDGIKATWSYDGSSLDIVLERK
ncbi:hypothetical protein [Bifidobacterium miconisargentati]|uniref:hypothetical protein n=1 Tax=Bifidobacterium miconisargentati TaxID=2834437 RepID=UPI001BDBB53C|nr:hypothetical protein [Bifidobacterium miconisargentati]MBW3090598.1 hypothetical protein [Bifidobacterium miconisargentati]